MFLQAKFKNLFEIKKLIYAEKRAYIEENTEIYDTPCLRRYSCDLWVKQP